MTKGEKAVIAVLAYSAQFDHPLTMREVTSRLLTGVGLQTIDGSFSSRDRLGRDTQAILRSLVKQKMLIQKNGLFTLPGKQLSFKKRFQATAAQSKKVALIKELSQLARKSWWIVCIAITGSYAAGGAGEEDDVDFLVITRRNRLWLTRLWLLFQSWKRNRRPQLGGDISHSWDLNFWLDETRLALPAHRQTVYEAYEILQTRWIFEREQTYQKFLLANPWMAKFLLHPPASQPLLPLEKPTQSLLLTLLNALAFYLQIGYRTLRHGRQKADFHSAFFHPSGTKRMIFLAWKSLYERALGKKIVLATGAFDVLHKEHKNFLKAAKKIGDFLMVGLESDQRIKKIKGTDRPVNTQAVRQKNLDRWRIADVVFSLPEHFKNPQREKLIAQLWPHVLAVSAYSPHLEDKRRVLKKFGGKVEVVLPFNPTISTTQLLQRQKKG